MNKLFLNILFFCHYSMAMHSPILIAVLMVKDEQAVIEMTLQPLLDAGVDSFFVFDTGSTDNTIEITKNFFVKNNIVFGYIEQEPFIDFATSRNRALERAQQLFPHAAFMLMLDAEWYLKNGSSLIDFCHICLARNDMYTSYVIRIFNETFDFYVPRLIRCNSNVQFEGVVHEIIRSQTRVKVPSNIYFEYLPTMQGIEKTYDRYQKDKKLLHQEYVKNPSNTRTLFYLAMTCQALGHLEEAYNFYKKRADFVTFDEEYFMSYYKLAQVIEKLSYNNTSYKWDEALNYYLKAYEMRSHRIEPLISIAQYYIAHNDIEKALPFVQCAIEIPYPQEDMLFVEKHMYDYVRHRLLKRCEPFIIK